MSAAESAHRTLGPAVAGSWYPANPRGLASQVDEMLAEASAPAAPPGNVLALIEPHAGFQYSGQVAAHGFRAVAGGDFTRVLLIGPSHYARFRGAVVPDADEYRTPLGGVALEREVLRALAALPEFTIGNEPFRPEHCLEAEIPFLQRTLSPGWRLLPVLLGGGTSGPTAERVARALEPLLGPSTLVVVSSDFTHFGPRFGYVPFRVDVPEKLRELDMGAVRRIEQRDVEGFEAYLSKTGATVCGRDAIDVLLRMLPAHATCALAAYDTSGRITGEWDHSVSYAALVFRSGAEG